MKVLFLAKATRPDYMCDMVYHGLKSTDSIVVEEINTPHYMYSYYMTKRDLYGKGFTMYGHLTKYPTCISISEMLNRVKRKYYDYIIYGSIQRFEKFFDLVSQSYPKDKILAIDGEDEDRIDLRYVKASTYYKREMSCTLEDVKPINFCIPERLIVQEPKIKNKRVAHIIPGDISTYIFDQENLYYQDYQHSIFGITKKKAGWDCLRHYEILMNGCIPYFIDLQSCPRLTMNQFPKEMILETNKLFDQNSEFDHKQHQRELLNYTRQHLTTNRLINSILVS
jgi:hypothetical protein